jgi:precorrin-6Y C5,15-methyltransferase (decarboxylating)
VSKICIIGIGYRPLDKKAKEALYKSDVVLTNSRLLEVFKSYEEHDKVKDRIVVIDNVHETIDYIKAEVQKSTLSLLASGDPMFFGIGRVITEEFDKDIVEIYPDLSSVQTAFSRIKEAWNGAFLMSVHGGPDPSKRRKLEYAMNDIPLLLARHNKIAILTDKVNNPAVIARTISESFSLPRFPAFPLIMFVCEKLGYPDEKIIKGTPEEISQMQFAEPNVVIVVRKPESAEAQKENTSALIFGLKEDELQHSRGLITKNEVRAVTVHTLRLPQKGVLWDIGAGSGSVSIEAARLCPALEVYSIEKDEEQIINISENRNRFNAVNIQIVKGGAPDALKDLPAPDRVFIGGSGGRVDEIVDMIAEKMISGIVVINATTIETLNEAVQGLGKNNFTVDVSEVSVSRSKMVGSKRHMSALNPVFIITGRK